MNAASAIAVAAPYTASPGLMDVLQVTTLVLVAAGATAVALIRVPVRQVIALSAYGLLLAVGALVLAFLALYWRRLPVLRRGFEPGRGLTRPIARFQSGVVNDYVTWVVIGLACLGGALAFAIR